MKKAPVPFGEDIAMQQKIYVVTMYRFANRERHSYVVGVFTTTRAAKQAARAEQLYRGGNKYYPEILEFEPNDTTSQRAILELSGAQSLP